MSSETIEVIPVKNIITVSNDLNAVDIVDNKPNVCVNAPGPQGAPGIAGNTENVTNTYVAGEAIGAYKVVKLETDGLLYLADKDTLGDIDKIIGISTSSGGISANIQTLEKGFKINSLLNSFVSGAVFLGNTGNLTQTVPTSGFCEKLGFIPQAGEVYIQLTEGLILN